MYDRVIVCGPIGPLRDNIDTLLQSNFLGDNQQTRKRTSFFGESREARDDDDESYFLDDDLTISQNSLDFKDNADFETENLSSNDTSMIHSFKNDNEVITLSRSAIVRPEANKDEEIDKDSDTIEINYKKTKKKAKMSLPSFSITNKDDQNG